MEVERTTFVAKPLFKNLEYNAIQKMSDSELMKLMDVDSRYFELVEDPSPLLRVVYAEKIVKHIAIHNKLSNGSPSVVSLVEKFLETVESKEETMKKLGVLRANAIHFIKEDK